MIDRHQMELHSSADAFIWAALQIPTGRHHVMPLPVFGEWSVARIVFHMLWYETSVIRPAVAAWDDTPGFPDEGEEIAAWGDNTTSVEAMLTQLREQREVLVTLLDEQQLDLAAKQTTPWGRVTLRWWLLHAYQHTLDYTNTLLSMALYWDQYLEAQKQARLEQREKNEAGWIPPEE
jgi:hypothetical protein